MSESVELAPACPTTDSEAREAVAEADEYIVSSGLARPTRSISFRSRCWGPRLLAPAIVAPAVDVELLCLVLLLPVPDCRLVCPP